MSSHRYTKPERICLKKHAEYQERWASGPHCRGSEHSWDSGISSCSTENVDKSEPGDLTSSYQAAPAERISRGPDLVPSRTPDLRPR